MNFTRLEIKNLRNISHIELKPFEHVNFIIGENGSGKTTVLEAIYLLALGRSFRTHLPKRYIQRGQSEIGLYSLVASSVGHEIALGLEKKMGEESRIRLNQQEVVNILDLVNTVPILLMNVDSLKLLVEGPQERRKFFNFGMFHVKHQFFPLWKHYTAIVKQRNKALRSYSDTSLITAWDQVMVDCAKQLQCLRNDFLNLFTQHLEFNLKKFVIFKKVEIELMHGWDIKTDLAEILKESFVKDKELGYTTKGPHRFDFKIKIDEMPVADILSRGQLKLLICSMFLAMHKVIKDQAEKNCIFLIDDLHAEFDEQNYSNIFKELKEIKTQLFITATSDMGVPEEDKQCCFYIRDGEIVDRKRG